MKTKRNRKNRTHRRAQNQASNHKQITNVSAPVSTQQTNSSYFGSFLQNVSDGINYVATSVKKTPAVLMATLGLLSQTGAAHTKTFCLQRDTNEIISIELAEGSTVSSDYIYPQLENVLKDLLKSVYHLISCVDLSFDEIHTLPSKTIGEAVKLEGNKISLPPDFNGIEEKFKNAIVGMDDSITFDRWMVGAGVSASVAIILIAVYYIHRKSSTNAKDTATEASSLLEKSDKSLKFT